MMNPEYYLTKMRALIEEFEPSRERSLAETKFDECKMWLSKCTPTEEALNRDQAAPDPSEVFNVLTARSVPIGDRLQFPFKAY